MNRHDNSMFLTCSVRPSMRPTCSCQCLRVSKLWRSYRFALRRDIVGRPTFMSTVACLMPGPFGMAFSKVDAAMQESHTQICGICADDGDDDETRGGTTNSHFQCKHYFHAGCVATYKNMLKEHGCVPGCPACAPARSTSHAQHSSTSISEQGSPLRTLAQQPSEAATLAYSEDGEAQREAPEHVGNDGVSIGIGGAAEPTQPVSRDAEGISVNQVLRMQQSVICSHCKLECAISKARVTSKKTGMAMFDVSLKNCINLNKTWMAAQSVLFHDGRSDCGVLQDIAFRPEHAGERNRTVGKGLQKSRDVLWQWRTVSASQLLSKC